MATFHTGVRDIGAGWAAALNLWIAFATGTYTSWSYLLTTLGIAHAIQIDVDLPAGGTDHHIIAIVDTDFNNPIGLREMFTAPAWRAMPQGVLPSFVAGLTPVDAAFNSGPWALRGDLIAVWTGAAETNNTNDQHSGSFGEQYTVYRRVAKYGSVVFVDVIGIMWGTLSTIDSIDGQPTDFIGAAGSVIQAPASGSVDLTPVVNAIEDVASQDVDWMANQGGSVWSLRSRVRVP